MIGEHVMTAGDAFIMLIILMTGSLAIGVIVGKIIKFGMGK